MDGLPVLCVTAKSRRGMSAALDGYRGLFGGCRGLTELHTHAASCQHVSLTREQRSMERKRASDFPQGLLSLFDEYVHGGISRRTFLYRAQKYAVGGVTATALFEMLRPNYAWAVQVEKNDSRIKADSTMVPSPKGNGSIGGYWVRPANATEKLPVVVVIHENRGLNPYIEDVARRLGVANFIAFAADGLTSVGGYPGDDEKGAELFKQVDGAKMLQDFLAAAAWLKSHPDGT